MTHPGRLEQAYYSTRIIKAGALLADTKTLLANWDLARPVADNLDRLRRDNLFGKTSRSRIEDILVIFRQRYLAAPDVTEALVTLTRSAFPAESMDRLLYFHSAQADPLLHDTVTEILYERHAQGRFELSVDEMQRALGHWMEDGKTTSQWGPYTLGRVARGLVATLRDFGVLSGAVHKRLAPVYLPVEAFCYIAFCLHQRQPSGERLVGDPEWRLFFLTRSSVERYFIEAHQRHLLEYHAAGSIIRVTFPSPSLSEYAHVIAQATI
jgi:hypothetical protein